MPEAKANHDRHDGCQHEQAIARHNITVPIVENAYASSSSPRSVVPWKDVCFNAASCVFFGAASAAALILE